LLWNQSEVDPGASVLAPVNHTTDEDRGLGLSNPRKRLKQRTRLRGLPMCSRVPQLATANNKGVNPSQGRAQTHSCCDMDNAGKRDRRCRPWIGWAAKKRSQFDDLLRSAKSAPTPGRVRDLLTIFAVDGSLHGDGNETGLLANHQHIAHRTLLPIRDGGVTAAHLPTITPLVELPGFRVPRPLA
jgi:hypothetical protein